MPYRTIKRNVKNTQPSRHVTFRIGNDSYRLPLDKLPQFEVQIGTHGAILEEVCRQYIREMSHINKDLEILSMETEVKQYIELQKRAHDLACMLNEAYTGLSQVKQTAKARKSSPMNTIHPKRPGAEHKPDFVYEKTIPETDQNYKTYARRIFEQGIESELAGDDAKAMQHYTIAGKIDPSNHDITESYQTVAKRLRTRDKGG